MPPRRRAAAGLGVAAGPRPIVAPVQHPRWPHATPAAQRQSARELADRTPPAAPILGLRAGPGFAPPRACVPTPAPRSPATACGATRTHRLRRASAGAIPRPGRTVAGDTRNGPAHHKRAPIRVKRATRAATGHRTARTPALTIATTTPTRTGITIAATGASTLTVTSTWRTTAGAAQTAPTSPRSDTDAPSTTAPTATASIAARLTATITTSTGAASTPTSPALGTGLSARWPMSAPSAPTGTYN